MKPFAALVIVALFAFACGCEKPAHGKVIQRVYTPSSVGVGTGFANGSNGGLRPVTVTTFQSEKYTLIIQNDDGTVSTREVSATTYAASPEGTRWDEKD